MVNKAVLKVDTSSSGSDKILSTILSVKGVQKVEIDYKGNYPLYTVTGGFALADLLKAVESKSKYVSVESIEEVKKKEKEKEKKKEKENENQIVLKPDSDGWISLPKHISGIPKGTNLFFKIENLHLCNQKH